MIDSSNERFVILAVIVPGHWCSTLSKVALVDIAEAFAAKGNFKPLVCEA